jgi:hypothetical protein
LAAVVADVADGLNSIHEAGWSHDDVKTSNFGVLPGALNNSTDPHTQKDGMLVSSTRADRAGRSGQVVMSRPPGPSIVHAHSVYFMDFGSSQLLADAGRRQRDVHTGTPGAYPSYYFEDWPALTTGLMNQGMAAADVFKLGDIFALGMSVASLCAGIAQPRGFLKNACGVGYAQLFQLGGNYRLAVAALPVGSRLAFLKYIRGGHNANDCVSLEYHSSLCLPMSAAADSSLLTCTWVPAIWAVLDELSFSMVKIAGDGVASTAACLPTMTLAQARDQLRSVATTLYNTDDDASSQPAAKRHKR